MGWQHYFDDAIDSLEEGGLPRRLLKRLLFDTGLCIGSRVLVAGLSETRLPRMLDGLGIDVVGIDDRPGVLETAAHSLPQIDLLTIPESGPIPFPSHSFDIVIVRGTAAHASGIHTKRAMRLTADLAALLRPSGQLAFLDTAPRPERTAAIAEHLESLPGELRCERFTNGWSSRENAELTTLRIPADTMDRDEWQVLADAAIRSRTMTRYSEAERPAA